MPGTILLGVDIETADEASASYARWGLEFLLREDVPATWYVTGRTLERYADLFAEADRADLVDLQAHTYDHILLKTVLMEIPPGRVVHGRTDWYFKPAVGPGQIDADLSRCQRVFEEVLGRRARGLTCPYGYYRGLADRPDLLQVVHGHGFRFLRSFARNERDGQPVPMAWQPFFYAVQGFPDVLELMVHDYQDDFYFVQFRGLPDAGTYPDHLRRVADHVAAEDLVWSLCSHDHGCDTAEGFAAKMVWLRDLVRYARSLGIRFVTASEYYEERVAAGRS